MSKIEVLVINRQEVLHFEEESIKGILLPQTRHTSASVTIVEPARTQTPHTHNRPDNGAEIVFVYAGAFELLSNGKVVAAHNVDKEGPVYVSTSAGSEAYFKNVGTTEVRMFSVFAPPFSPGEIIYRDGE